MTKTSERVRVGLAMSPEVKSVLDELAASPRFAGNRSRAAAWAIQVGALVLNDERVAPVLFGKPSDVLDHYDATRGKSKQKRLPMG